MAVKGVFASDMSIVGDPKGDFAAALLQEVPTGSAMLLALSSGMPSKPAIDVIVHWFEEKHLSGRTQVNGAVNSTSTTTVVVDDASFLVANAICLIEATGEFVLITAVSGNSLTVIRGFGGSTAANIPDDAGFQKIGTAAEEGSQAPAAVANLGYPRFNYTQIFRNVWSVTGTTKAVQYWTGDKVAKNRADAALQHGEDIERSLWFGRMALGVVNNMPYRTMAGLDSLITTNVTAAGATTSWTQLDSFLQGVFSKNIKGKPNERIAFTGNGGLSVIQQIARLHSTVFIEAGQTEFGLNITKWITPYGNISLMTHPLFTENPLWTKDLRILHPGAVTMRWLRRTTEDAYDENGTRAGVDADYGVYTSELSLEYDLERTGGRLTGLTAGVQG
jgi:hypothetical protein